MNITHIQFHIGDFLSGVMQMDGAEIGAYTMLIMAHYQAGFEGIPDDERKLRQITRTSPKVWSRIKETVLDKFYLEDGFWKHSRIIEELEKIHEKSGPGRGHKRQNGNPKESVEKPLSESQVENKPLENNESEKTNLKPITNNHSKKEKLKKEKKDFDEFWELCPRKVGKGKAEKSYWKAREELSKDRLHAAMRVHKSEMSSREKQFIPHPATWLNEKRFYDEGMDSGKTTEDWPDWKFSLAAGIGEPAVHAWFGNAKAENGVLTVNGKFRKEWIESHYIEDVNRIGIREIRYE